MQFLLQCNAIAGRENDQIKQRTETKKKKRNKKKKKDYAQASTTDRLN